MTKTIEKLEATAQLDRAATALGDALAEAQEITSSKGSRHMEMTETLAKCLQHVFELTKAGLVAKESPGHIRSSMSRLRTAMTLLQTTSISAPGIERTMRMTARSLALLYPVSTLIEQLAEMHDSSERPDLPSSPPMMRDETYRERRSTLRQIVEVEIGMYADTNFFTGFSADVSSGGLFISTYDVLSIGTKLNLNFALPTGPILSVNGVVRWVREFNEMSPEIMPGMGVQFEHLSSEDAELINRHMSEIPPMFYE